jgi:hypothetical protein
LNAWNSRIREIESGEPAAYNLLVRICQNEIAREGEKERSDDNTVLACLVSRFDPVRERRDQA